MIVTNLDKGSEEFAVLPPRAGAQRSALAEASAHREAQAILQGIEKFFFAFERDVEAALVMRQKIVFGIIVGTFTKDLPINFLDFLLFSKGIKNSLRQQHHSTTAIRTKGPEKWLALCGSERVAGLAGASRLNRSNGRWWA